MSEKKAYQVRLRLPDNASKTIEVASAADTLDAKAQASKQYYGHVFTGQFSRMAVRLKR